jgi:hypothetical protein
MKAAPLPPTPWNQSRRFPPPQTAGAPLRYGGLQGGPHRPVFRGGLASFARRSCCRSFRALAKHLLYQSPARETSEREETG